MQDPSIYTYINARPQPQPQQQQQPQFPEQEQLKCPRCDSINTKFCYYNNYNLAQPRHFCKSCRRYWTKGGVLRNIPVGGGSRKNTKRSSSSSSAAVSSSTAHHPKRPAAVSASSVSPPPPPVSISGTNTETFPLKADNYQGQFGNISSFLGSSSGRFGNFLDGLHSNETNLPMDVSGCGPGTGTGQDPVQNVEPQLRLDLEGGSNNIADEFLDVQVGDDETTCWNGGNGWADLAMYTPGSTFGN